MPAIETAFPRRIRPIRTANTVLAVGDGRIPGTNLPGSVTRSPSSPARVPAISLVWKLFSPLTHKETTMAQHIHARLGFSKATDKEVIATCGAVIAGLTGNKDLVPHIRQSFSRIRTGE